MIPHLCNREAILTKQLNEFWCKEEAQVPPIRVHWFFYLPTYPPPLIDCLRPPWLYVVSHLDCLQAGAGKVVSACVPNEAESRWRRSGHRNVIHKIISPKKLRIIREFGRMSVYRRTIVAGICKFRLYHLKSNVSWFFSKAKNSKAAFWELTWFLVRP